MRTLLETDERADTEVTLGMSALLGIFFGLVVMCGVFFGFGYSMGRKSTPPTAAIPAPTETSTAPATDSNSTYPPKPSADQAARRTSPATPAPTGASTADATGEPSDSSSVKPPPAAGSPPPGEESAAGFSKPVAKPVVKPAAVALPVAVAPPRSQPPVAAVRAPAPAAPSASTVPSGPAAGQLMVQIAAVSHPEDADVLISALRKRGYNVSVHSEAQDKLMHVQVGPFSTRAEAVAIRQKLLADGYNAFIK